MCAALSARKGMESTFARHCCRWIMTVFMLALFAQSSETVRVKDCVSEKFYRYSIRHTACLPKSSGAERGGVSSFERKFIVDKHNELRARENAANMQRMVWDDELEKVAQRWADNCKFENDEERRIPGRFFVGQNLAAGHDVWREVLQEWSNQSRRFVYGDERANKFNSVNYYTQMVWAESAKIGCGYTYCSNLPPHKHLYVCNYGPEGNHVWWEPYKLGKKCADCSSKCSNDLCDCGGKVCGNGGTLNLTTCECKCKRSWQMPNRECGLNCKAVREQHTCKPGGIFHGKCIRYTNIPDACPQSCNVCPYSGFQNDGRQAVDDYSDEDNIHGSGDYSGDDDDDDEDNPKKIARTVKIKDCISEKFYRFSTKHTACVLKSDGAVTGGVLASDQELIVAKHNAIRAKQLATNMQKMVWDDELAAVAQRWADNCKFKSDRTRELPGRFFAGQNMASGHDTWEEVINGWSNESEFFHFGDQEKTYFLKVWHYTQMVWAGSAKIGCGYTYCSNLEPYKHLYVCNYGPEGNTIWWKPYKSGSKCADCPDKCVDDLCDCGGKVCGNGGTLNLTTCECSCEKSWQLPDHDCAINCNAVNEAAICKPGGLYHGKCIKFINVPDECPLSCNICPYAGFQSVRNNEDIDYYGDAGANIKVDNESLTDEYDDIKDNIDIDIDIDNSESVGDDDNNYKRDGNVSKSNAAHSDINVVEGVSSENYNNKNMTAQGEDDDKKSDDINIKSDDSGRYNVSKGDRIGETEIGESIPNVNMSHSDGGHNDSRIDNNRYNISQHDSDKEVRTDEDYKHVDEHRNDVEKSDHSNITEATYSNDKSGFDSEDSEEGEDSEDSEESEESVDSEESDEDANNVGGLMFEHNVGMGSDHGDANKTDSNNVTEKDDDNNKEEIGASYLDTKRGNVSNNISTEEVDVKDKEDSWVGEDKNGNDKENSNDADDDAGDDAGDDIGNDAGDDAGDVARDDAGDVARDDAGDDAGDDGDKNVDTSTKEGEEDEKASAEKVESSVALCRLHPVLLIGSNLFLIAYQLRH